MKVVITRDSDGYIGFWPIKAIGDIFKSNLSGKWFSNKHKRLFGIEDDEKGICKLLEFTPRKGSKEVVDIPVRRYYSTELKK